MLVETDQLEGAGSEDGAVDGHGAVFVAGAAGLRVESKERGCICLYTRGVTVAEKCLRWRKNQGAIVQCVRAHDWLGVLQPAEPKVTQSTVRAHPGHARPPGALNIRSTE